MLRPQFASPIGFRVAFERNADVSTKATNFMEMDVALIAVSRQKTVAAVELLERRF